MTALADFRTDVGNPAGPDGGGRIYVTNVATGERRASPFVVEDWRVGARVKAITPSRVMRCWYREALVDGGLPDLEDFAGPVAFRLLGRLAGGVIDPNDLELMFPESRNGRVGGVSA